jgi:hyaluronoglucosaminidase
MDKDRLFLGPLRNRGKGLAKTHIGMISNPMIQWQASKIPVITMAKYMWDTNTYNADLAFDQAIHEFVKQQPYLFEYMKIFVKENEASLIYYDCYQDIDEAINHNDLEYLKQYMEKLLTAIKTLKKEFHNKKWLIEVDQWFHQIEKDYDIFLKIYNKKDLITIEDVKEGLYHNGSHLIYKLAKHLGLYQGQIYKRERPNFWDKKGKSYENL